MLVNPGGSTYTPTGRARPCRWSQPEKDVIEGQSLLSLRTVNNHRVLAVHRTNGSSLLLSKSLASTDKLLRQLDIVSLMIGAIGVAIAAVASAVVSRARPAAQSPSPDGA